MVKNVKENSLRCVEMVRKQLLHLPQCSKPNKESSELAQNDQCRRIVVRTDLFSHIYIIVEHPSARVQALKNISLVSKTC